MEGQHSASVVAQPVRAEELSPDHLVDVLAANCNSSGNALVGDAKGSTTLGNLPPLAGPSKGAPEHAILGSLVALSPRETIPITSWRRWASLCHWHCRSCTERLGYLLTGQVLAILTELAREVPRCKCGTLTIAPPPGMVLAELRRAVERLVSVHGGNAVWALKQQPSGRTVAYMLITTDDSKRLEKDGRTVVLGGSRSAKFTSVRGSDTVWSPANQVLAFNIGQVLRCLVQAGPPPNLRPGYRFGAFGRFAPLLANALAILQREHPCQAGGHHRTRERAGEISPEGQDGEQRTCRWCDLPVIGREWRHPRCSTRVWRAKLALRSELGPEDFDGFKYRVEVLVEAGLREPEAMLRAIPEFIGHGVAMPDEFVEVVSLPREPVPPGYRPRRASRLGKGTKGNVA